MKMRSLGMTAARFLSPFFASRWAENAVHFFEALQGIGTGAEFSRRELKAIFQGMPFSNPVIFDVGAHTGQFLREALKRTSPGCIIHAFEPASASFRELSKAFGSQSGIQLNRTALSRDFGSGVLFYDEPGSQLASLTARPRFGQAKSEGVRLETLDEYCRKNNIEQIDLLKLDVEGHELEVLEASVEMLGRRGIRRIVFEFGGCHIDTRVFFRDLYEFLTARGMHISRIMPSGKLLLFAQYSESLERFRTTNYLATFEPPR